MKIRAITTGANLTYPLDITLLQKIGYFNIQAKDFFQDHGIQVQTTRFTSQPWSAYLAGKQIKTRIRFVRELEERCRELDIDFASIGTVKSPVLIGTIPLMISNTSIISGSATIADIKTGIDHKAAKSTSAAILEIAKSTDQGNGNFRFAALGNCPSNIPFFPASYHKGKMRFSIGLECSDLLVKAFTRVQTLSQAAQNLEHCLMTELKIIAKLGQHLAKKTGMEFHGIDVSPAPSLSRQESIACAFEKLKLGKFGSPGTLAVAALVTHVLATLRIKKCGYSGLMLPILEDYGLAQRCAEGIIDIEDILLYSSVCGTGLDCIPLPGNITTAKIYAILLDMASLAIKLNKPLSARLFPVPGKKAGDMTHFRSPYLVNTRVMRVK